MDSERQQVVRLGGRTSLRIAALGLIGLVAASVGCIGELGDLGGAPSSGAGDGDGDGDADGGEGPGEGELLCDLGGMPLRRLTSTEYQNSLGALFPGVALPDAGPIPDGRVSGFTNQVDGQSVSALGVQRYEQLAEEVGRAAGADLATWAPCSDDSDGCLDEIVDTLTMRAFRRPLTADERDRKRTFARAMRAEHGMAEAVALYVTATIESPNFLYRPEVGVGAAATAGRVLLDDYELASRLSYFFLETMPDEGLFEAAAAGRLTTEDGYRAEVLRLLADPRARPALTRFFSEWLRVYKLASLGLDPNAFPEFDEALRVDLERSAQAYLDKALWEDDSFASLFGGTFGFVNDRLAPIFGVDPPGTDELVLVQLDASQRRGVLTQPGLLASTSHGISHSPIFRGVTVLESVLCRPTPPAPPGVLDNPNPVDVPPEEICTTRDLVSKSHTVGDCQGCHASIDGAGFVFENYDGVGRYRAVENGCAIDATGAFPAVEELVPVTNAIELADQLVATDVAPLCMSSHLIRFATGRAELREEECVTHALVEAMRAEGDSLQQAIVALVQSDVFRSRPEAP